MQKGIFGEVKTGHIQVVTVLLEESEQDQGMMEPHRGAVPHKLSSENAEWHRVL